MNPDLVVRDADGKVYTVRYDAVNAMLLNEFLKEHKTVQQQGQTIARLEKQLETLTATLQKVSAQLELNKPASQTVLNNRSAVKQPKQWAVVLHCMAAFCFTRGRSELVKIALVLISYCLSQCSKDRQIRPQVVRGLAVSVATRLP